jgi:hypothetical protein
VLSAESESARGGTTAKIIEGARKLPMSPKSIRSAVQEDHPGIFETKAIAEEGFVYGLPIVMNYAVMYEFCVDKNSNQYKAPFNELKNDIRNAESGCAFLGVPNPCLSYRHKIRASCSYALAKG